MLFQNKVVLITGASRGIGRKTAELFASHGAVVVVNGRNPDLLAKCCRELAEAHGAEVYPLVFDVSDPEEVKRGFRELFGITKRLDVLVNNAGVLDDALIGMVTNDQITRVFGVNTYSILYTSQYAARLMARNNSGCVINLSSIIGTNGNEGQAVYGGSKAAVIGITKSLAKELAPLNIRVNAVAPGFIDTDMTRNLPVEIYHERLSSIKMGRIGTPEDVANVILLLASDMATYVTGQVVGVDGGMLI